MNIQFYIKVSLIQMVTQNIMNFPWNGFKKINFSRVFQGVDPGNGLGLEMSGVIQQKNGYLNSF